MKILAELGHRSDGLLEYVYCYIVQKQHFNDVRRKLTRILDAHITFISL